MHAVTLCNRGMECGSIKCALTISGMETKEAQDAQIIFTHTLNSITDKAHMAAFNIGVELGQLVIVLPTATLLWWLWRRSPPTAARTVLLGSVTVVLAGATGRAGRGWDTFT